MPRENTQLIGITEVGHVDDAGTDVPWGLTQEEGITISENISTVSLFSGQGAGKKDSKVTQVEGTVTFRLLSANLITLARLKGLPDTAVAGDLDDTTTPTAEVLTVLSNELGNREFHLYAIAPGPEGPRRLDVLRAKVSQTGETAMSKTAWTLPQSTFDILETDAQEMYTITDAL